MAKKNFSDNSSVSNLPIWMVCCYLPFNYRRTLRTQKQRENLLLYEALDGMVDSKGSIAQIFDKTSPIWGKKHLDAITHCIKEREDTWTYLKTVTSEEGRERLETFELMYVVDGKIGIPTYILNAGFGRVECYLDAMILRKKGFSYT